MASFKSIQIDLWLPLSNYLIINIDIECFPCPAISSKKLQINFEFRGRVRKVEKLPNFRIASWS